MENLTIVGMKELSNRVFMIERSLKSIAKSLETLVKIQNKQFPSKKLVTDWDPNNGLDIHLEDDEEEN